MKIINDMPNELYHARPELSSSQIRQLLTNPYLYFSGFKQDETEAMRFGTAVHTAVLEPDLFASSYAVEPIADGRNTAGKAIKAEFALASAGKTIITATQAETISGIKNSLETATFSNGAKVADLFKNGVAEQSVFGTVTNRNGELIPARCRPDYRLGDTLIDLKTTQDASVDGFSRSVAKFGYHIQAEWYLQVTGAKRFIFVAAETKPPYMVGIYDLNIVYRELAQDEILRALDDLAQPEKYQTPVFIASDNSDIHTLTPPNYLFYKDGVNF